MAWDAVWAFAVWLASGAWAFLTTGWDAAKVIASIAGLVSIISTGIGIWIKYRTTGRQLVRRMLEMIATREQRLTAARENLARVSVLPSPAVPIEAPVFPQANLESKLREMKWGRVPKAAKALGQAVEQADTRAKVATRRAEYQRKEKALGHLMLGAIEASRKSDHPIEMAAYRSKALAEFDQALAINQLDPDALQYAGLVLLQMPNPAGALDKFIALTDVLKGMGDAVRLARAYRLQANAYARLPDQQLGNANISMIQAVATYPPGVNPIELAECHEYHGDIRTKMKNYVKANTSYQNALTILHANRRHATAMEGISRVSAKLAELNIVQFAKANGVATAQQAATDQ